MDEFRGMKPQDVVRYIDGDVRIGDVPLDLGITNASVEMQEKAVIIGLSDELPEHNETYDLHRFLGVLLSNNLDYYEKVEIMEKEYELELPEEWEEEMQDMYSFAAEIRKKGEARGICIMARNMLKNGVPISQIAQMAEVSVEKLQSWLQETDEITKE